MLNHQPTTIDYVDPKNGLTHTDKEVNSGVLKKHTVGSESECSAARFVSFDSRLRLRVLKTTPHGFCVFSCDSC